MIPPWSTLDVPGATLHYEVTGTGPVLLLIGSAPADTTSFGGVRLLLCDLYSVVTYGHRDLSVPVQADDAHRILAEVTAEPAFVAAFGAGALVALELARTHPTQVRSLVVHEPLLQLTGYAPDLDALRDAGIPVVFAAGAESRGTPSHEAAAALAERSGAELVVLPGEHHGITMYPVEFAAVLEGAFGA